MISITFCQIPITSDYSFELSVTFADVV